MLRTDRLQGLDPREPVLQGWRLQDYLAHAQQYTAAGIDLTTERLVTAVMPNWA